MPLNVNEKQVREKIRASSALGVKMVTIPALMVSPLCLLDEGGLLGLFGECLWIESPPLCLTFGEREISLSSRLNHMSSHLPSTLMCLGAPRSLGFICASNDSVSFLAQTPQVARKSCEVRDSQIFPQCIHLTSFCTTSSYEGKPFGSKFSNIITSGSPEPRASQSRSRSNVFVSPHSHSRMSVRLPSLQTR